jgi:hypothetical protein
MSLLPSHTSQRYDSEQEEEADADRQQAPNRKATNKVLSLLAHWHHLRSVWVVDWGIHTSCIDALIITVAIAIIVVIIIGIIITGIMIIMNNKNNYLMTILLPSKVLL